MFIFVQPFTSLQSFRNGSSSSFLFFFLPFPERVTFMTHQVMPSLTGQSGACSILTSHFRTWYQVHHLMETLKASRVGTSGKEAFDSCTAETCQSQGSHTFKNTLLFFFYLRVFLNRISYGVKKILQNVLKVESKSCFRIGCYRISNLYCMCALPPPQLSPSGGHHKQCRFLGTSAAASFSQTMKCAITTVKTAELERK